MANTARLRIERVRVALAARFAPTLMRWHSLPTTTQRALATAAVIVALALLWALWWQPLHQQRQAMTERLPQLRAQLAAMRMQSEEIKRLQAVPAAAASGSSVDRLADLPTLQELMGTEARVQLDANARFVISAKQMSYFQFIERLDTVLGRFNLRVVSLNFTAQSGTDAPVGSVSIEALLADGLRSGSAGSPSK